MTPVSAGVRIQLEATPGPARSFAPGPARSFAPMRAGLLQRKCACGDTPGPDGECAACRAKQLGLQRRSEVHAELSTVPHVVHEVLRSPGQPLDTATRAFMEPRFGHAFSQVRVDRLVPMAPVQTTLAISQPGDGDEQEAERMANTVLRLPGQDRVTIQPVRVAQRRDADWADHTVVPETVSRSVERVRGDGAPLTEAARTFFEPRFSYDFRRVRVHTDSRADNSARAINALAYTCGHDVVFRAGQYAPATGKGRRLLAHELTHVVQQDIGMELRRPAASVIQRAVSYDECSPTQETTILDTHNRAIAMIDTARTKLASYNGTTPPEVRTALDTHFHATGTTFAGFMRFKLGNLKDASDSPQYECQSTQIGSRMGWSMWCVPFSDIELYPLWFAESDIDIRARTMIHEWEHRYGCKFDLGYGWQEGYSGHGTLRSLLNADSFARFVYDVR